MSTSANFSHRSPLYTFVSTIGQNNIRGLFCTLSKAFLVHVTFSYHSCWVLDFEQRLHYSPDFFWCNQWKLVAWWRVWRFKKVKSETFLKMWKPDTHLAFREVFGDNRKFPLRQSFNYQSHGGNPSLTDSRRTTNYAPLPSMTIQIRWCLFGIRIQCVDNLKTCLIQTSSEVNWKIVWWWAGIYPYVPIYR